VLFQIHAQFRGATGNIVAVNTASEGFVFHLFSDRLGLDFGERLSGLDQSAGGDETCELVAGEQRFFHRSLPGDTGVFSVRHDCLADFLSVATLFQNLISLVGMIFQAGILFVVKVVQQSDHAPELFVRGEFSGIGAHAGLDGEGMLAQTFGLRELS